MGQLNLLLVSAVTLTIGPITLLQACYLSGAPHCFCQAQMEWGGIAALGCWKSVEVSLLVKMHEEEASYCPLVYGGQSNGELGMLGIL